MHTLLLLLGAALVVALAYQLWHTLQLEVQSRQLQLERAEIVAERILQKAPSSRVAFLAVPAAQRMIVRDGVVQVDDSVGWIEPVPEAPDIVVADRLARAARAEFGQKDPAAAAREFDELLAASLPAAQRLIVVGAAAWQSHRAGAAERLANLRKELDERIAELQPADLAQPAAAREVAAALRLPRASGAPAWATRLAPFLPAALMAGTGGAEAWFAAQQVVVARRELLVAVQRDWRAKDFAGSIGIAPVGDQTLLWWMSRDDGGRDVARLTLAQWLSAVRSAGTAGALPEWPWLVDVEFAREAAQVFAGIPFVRGLRATADSALDQRPWLLPTLTLCLLVAFGLAVWQQFRAARREAAAVAAQAEFLTTVTHELKTPLASIRLLGEMLLEGRAVGRETDYYRMLAGEAGRLSMLIENVLDLGRVERGERAYDLRRLDVGEIVRETIELLAPLGELERAPIAVLKPDTALFAQLDRSALVQALISVLDNARKYGSGAIGVRVFACDATHMTIEVRDRGPGVPLAERERIFERFVRGSAHQHGSTPGVGIGLYLARTIARRLGGELACEAPADGGPGSVFCFTLPMESQT
ncbi:MAG: HAMP domain-containing histidine kinase [Planctomycetes bacterium]|nr:HAMP domain-containing histidine kinase [Planctomycetota bacterium]